jgi:hypothetical protein
VLLQDDFTNPNSGWPQLSDNQTLSGYHPPNFYHIESRQPNTRSPVFFNRQLSDFTMEADLFTENSDTENGEFLYGLVVRRVGENYYAFMASPRTGNWQVIKNSASGSEVIASGNEDSLQGTSSAARDRLRVDADGDMLIFHINGRALATVQDDDYLSGDMGFVVETFDEPRVHVHFDSLIVREPEIDLEAAPAPIIVGEVVAEVVPTQAPEINTPEPATAVPSPEPEATVTPAGPQPSSLGMVMVDGGLYTVGSDTAVTLTDFWIDRYEVSNAEFAQFVAATGAEAPAYWLENDIPTNLGDHPVQSITYVTAVAYCQSLHKRLPSEAEW